MNAIAFPAPQAASAAGRFAGADDASALTHDFNNLLTVLMGASEQLLGDLPAGSEHHDLAKVCLDAAERGAKLLARLRAVAEPAAPDAEAVDTAQVLGVTQRFMRQAARENIEVRATAPAGLACLSDRAELERALLNLSLNAAHAMPDGGCIRLEAAKARLGRIASHRLGLAAGDYARFSVRDQGAGMSPEILARATEPYFTTRPDAGGTGLGLASVADFARAAGGALDIASKVGAGTTVTLYLPLA